MEEAGSKKYRLVIGTVPIDCVFCFPETHFYFRKFLLEEDVWGKIPVAQVKETAYKDWEKSGHSVDGFGEFCLMCQPVSEALFAYNCCVFHAAAIRYKDKAILIAGASGAGKSTHCHMLLERYPDEFSVINGDKPVLEYMDHSIRVHPSPWNGKEGLHGAASAPLAGVFFLKRGKKNAIERCSDKEAAICAFPMVFQSFEKETVIREAGIITEKIVQSAPCYLFHSLDIEASSVLLYQAIKEVC